MIRAKQGQGEAGIEITPMIDMVFLLLIFFLVSTTFHQTEREMEIALPEAVAGTPISMTLREIVINVRANGSVVLSGRDVTLDELQSIVEQAVTINPQQKVSVRGDQTTAYANVVAVLDVCKAAGVAAPFLDTRPSQ